MSNFVMPTLGFWGLCWDFCTRAHPGLIHHIQTLKSSTGTLWEEQENALQICFPRLLHYYSCTKANTIAVLLAMTTRTFLSKILPFPPLSSRSARILEMLLLPTYLPSVTHEGKDTESPLLRECSDKFFQRFWGQRKASQQLWTLFAAWRLTRSSKMVMNWFDFEQIHSIQPLILYQDAIWIYSILSPLRLFW